MHSIMHSKTWVIDDHVMLTGSVNATDNGMSNNIEDFYVLRDSQTVEEWKAHFMENWNGPTTRPVTREVMKTVMAKRKEKTDRQNAEAMSRNQRKWNGGDQRIKLKEVSMSRPDPD